MHINHLMLKNKALNLILVPGNFSFGLSLLITPSIPVTPSLLITTSYDSESECYSKYPEAKSIVERIRSLGGTVFFQVDATKLDRHKDLKKMVYDTIAFNFPHVGEIFHSIKSY